ncbi:MAG TPA: thiolase family protein [Tepidisphaeraceae bacterium]|nr:thiolase family protein [Tepidisphaeraceae bacterium]
MVAINSTPRVAIIAGCRTPWVKSGTLLRATHASELGRLAIQETLCRASFQPDSLDEVILGNVVMPADAANLARVSALWAGVPASVPALTVQRNCASGIEAVAQAATKIRAGQAKSIIAGGVESMSTIPLLFSQTATDAFTSLARARTPWQRATAMAHFRPRDFKPVIGLELGLTDPTCGLIMGKTAEVLAHEFSISRHEQDEFALRSHQRAVAAHAAGRLSDETFAIYAGEKFSPVTHDNGPRENQSMAALARLKPLFEKRDGTVTAGNSCQLTDGAAALLVMDADTAEAEGREILGYVNSFAFTGLDPAHMGLGPVYAISSLLDQTGLTMADIDLFEVNEAFAAQVLACQKALASDSFARQHLNRERALGAIDAEKLNVNGGAIALGHPVGATGARLILTLLMEMRRRDVHRGIAALCVGGGQGAAILLERR